MRSVVFLFLLTLVSCGPKAEKAPETPEATQPTMVQIVSTYYQALNTYDQEKFLSTISDSIRVGEGGYSTAYSQEDYKHWLAWDVVFKPLYAVQEIEVFEDQHYVEVNVEKSDRRIRFLNDRSIITRHRIHFKGGKIHSEEVVKYIRFDETKWVTNREELVAWIADNHPELNGFIHDQTEQGGRNYLQAIQLFEAREIPSDSQQ